MKPTSICLLLCLTFAADVSAQTFSKYFAIDSASTLAYSIVEKDSFLFVCGVVVDTSFPSAIKSYWAKFDNSGNIISSVSFRPDRFLYYYVVDKNGLISTADKGIAAAGFTVDTNSIDSICFTKFDSEGNLLFYKTYAPNIQNYRHVFAYSLTEHDSAYYLVGIIQLPNYYVSPLMIKLDLSGNLEYIKVYNLLPQMYDGTSESICSLPNGNLLLAVGSTDGNINYWQSIQTTCFLEIDTAGNLVKYYCTDDNNTMAYYNVGTTYDGNYLSSGSYYQTRVQGEAELYIKYLVKWDTSFNIIWSLKTGGVEAENAFSDFEQSQNNNVILCGQNIADTGHCPGFHGVIAQVSKEGGLNWFREYSVPVPSGSDINGLQNYLYDLDLMPNGDIIAVGSWQTSSLNSPLYFQQVGWIIRVDSNGCMDNGSCGLETDIQTIFPEAYNLYYSIQVTPNPSKGIFTITPLLDLPAACTIEVYDELARKLFTQPVFNHSNLINLYHLPSGIYFYKIGNGLVNAGEGKFVIQK